MSIFYNSVFGSRFPVRASETDESLIVEAALPGVQKEDITVKLERGILTIGAEFGNDPDDVLLSEFTEGKVSRSLRVRDTDLDTSKGSSVFENGVLRVTIPKTENATNQIPVL